MNDNRNGLFEVVVKSMVGDSEILLSDSSSAFGVDEEEEVNSVLASFLEARGVW